MHHDINFEAITNLMHKYLYSYNITILYMFRALLCSSSGGSIVYAQHLVPSLSMSGRTLHWLRQRGFFHRECGIRELCWTAVQHTSPHRTHARTYTKCYAAASPHWLFIFLTNFKISDFNKKHTNSLKMIWMMIETYWSFLSVLIRTF